MKKIFYMYTLLAVLLFSSCNYLDIVPDERVSNEDTYSTPDRLKGFFFSCYGFLPSNRAILDQTYWWTQGEETTYFKKEAFSYFNEGNYSPTSLQMTSTTWSNVWRGIRQCYMFLAIVDKTKNMNPEEIIRYKAEVNFLIAYYHFISLRSYGPTVIIDKLTNENIPITEFPERSSFDEVVAFIDKKIDEALPGLAEEHISTDFGRITKYTALALRSRMYLYAASPLYNGNSDMYADFVSKLDGRHLIAQQYSRDKWQKCADVTLDAIQQLEKYGFHLYGDTEAGTPNASKPSISNKAQRRIRYATLDYENNPEVIWADTRKEGVYGWQQRSMPVQTKSYIKDVQGCICPTLQTVESFYTKNGLPMEYDKTFDYEDRYSIVQLPPDNDGNNYYSQSTGTSMKLHAEREPRFYAWIGFHNGYHEITKYNGAIVSADHAKKAILLKLRNNDFGGRKNKSSNYSVTGYNNKKWCHPAYSDGPVDYPLVLFRLAELYLNYAEALVELDKLDQAREYVDKVRLRAGIPTVKDAWENYASTPDFYKTKEGMREIVRTERNLELYLEGHKFFDIRRWKIAEQYLGIPEKGLNTLGNTDQEFFQVKELNLTRAFHKGQYLMPIDINEINKNPNLVQNPYYN